MPDVLRALLISAVATGAAAVVLQALRPTPATVLDDPESEPYVDADRMSPEERALLMQELEGQL